MYLDKDKTPTFKASRTPYHRLKVIKTHHSARSSSHEISASLELLNNYILYILYTQ
jgi:hypothetical protein